MVFFAKIEAIEISNIIKTEILIAQNGFISVCCLNRIVFLIFLLHSCSHFGSFIRCAILYFPPSQPVSLPREGTLGFMASDRKSIERTVCNPTITLINKRRNTNPIIKLYLSKTALQPSVCVSLSRSRSVWDRTTVHFEAAVNAVIIICWFFFSEMYSPSAVSLNAGTRP